MLSVLKIQLDEVRVSQSGIVTAPIYFCVEDRFFPEEGWSDFPLIVLSWWLDEIAGGAEKSVFPFMDGPFEINSLRVGDDIQLSGVWRRKMGDRVIFSEFVSEKLLLAGIQSEAAALLSRLKDICPDNPDFKKLLSKVPQVH